MITVSEGKVLLSIAIVLIFQVIDVSIVIFLPICEG